ncbi:hypothetical protein BBJ28_00024041, partial [Nothophytophthora sp. Chile5]
MYNDPRRDAHPVDLSFSQILEVRSTQRRRRKPPVAAARLPQQPPRRIPPPPASSASYLEAEGDGAPAYGSGMLDSVYEGSEDMLEESDSGRDDLRGDASSGAGDPDSSTEDENWTTGDDGQLGQDMYRFVQPRRLSSWVQDDAVFACFKCHAVFSLLVRKHHCRACGRIFCSACSSQRVVIPVDYESTPVSPAYNSLTTNASDLIGNISWYFLSYSSPSAAAGGLDLGSSGGVGAAHRAQAFLDSGSVRLSPEEQQEKFLKDVQRLQETNVISKFTPCRSRSGSAASSVSNGAAPNATSSYVSAHVPDGSVMQRVCDDCACALQQRRHHYNAVKVFELCEFDLRELRTLGQVCRKWHRASIMCLSMFRQIQYYLPTHRLSEREKKLLIINRKFLGGHNKWLLQLIKAIDFSEETGAEQAASVSSSEAPELSPRDARAARRRHERNHALVDEVLELMQQERTHRCMLTMCSRLCKPHIGSVDALEVLADETICNLQLRAMAVDALLKTATENEWWSYLPVLLHSLSVESNAAGSKLGQSLIRQAQCDIRFCYDLYWGLTVMAEDASCRRKFDGMKQRLLLTLTQFKDNASCGRLLDDRKPGNDDIAEQLLRGQELVDLMFKIPPRIPVEDVRLILRASIEKSSLFGGATVESKARHKDQNQASTNGDQAWPLLRLPVDPQVKISGINFKTIEVKRSAEAPMVIACTGVNREEEEAEDATDSGAESQRNTWSRRAQTLPHYRLMYKRDDLRKDAIVQNIINVMYLILKQETRLDIPLVTYRVLPTSSFDGLIEIVENAHTLYSIIRDHGSILNFLHHYNGHRT